MRALYSLFMLLTLVVLAGCETGPNTGKGFSLPEGNAENGKVVFVELACNQCHFVADIKLLESDDKDFKGIQLGGSVLSVKSYGDLVTSIINPSHRISRRYYKGTESKEDDILKMLIYNDLMTVTQLVDLVTFLEQHYKVDPYTRTRYHKYGSIY